jgi:hypothetical protein
MHYSNTIFNQLLTFLPKDKFQQFVGQHEGDKWVKSLTTWNQLVVLLYAQSTGKDSLRDIETGLSLHGGTWHHLGIKTVARSSVSRANMNRDYRIFESLFYALLDRCRDVTPTHRFSFKNPLYSLDATTIELCLSLFDWATFRKTKGALKLHTLLNVRTMIPEVVVPTTGKTGDVKAGTYMDLPYRLESGSIVVFDRAYIDYRWWRALNDHDIFFVCRTKSNTRVTVLGQHTDVLEKGVVSDERVLIGEHYGYEKYPATLRKVRYYDDTTGSVYEFLTNNFTLSAVTIATIYKARWQVELFFKWIKQHLKIKTFLGTSPNAVLSQIWVAMIYYLLLTYIKYQTKFKKSLLELTRMFKEVLLVRRPLIDLLSLSTKTLDRLDPRAGPQMVLW